MPPKQDLLPTADEMNVGGLRKMLKLKKDETFKIGELSKAKKTKQGENFMFRGKEFKMTPLMSKRINLALSLMRLPKRKAAGQFYMKNKGKSTKTNPIDYDLLIDATSLHAANNNLGLASIDSYHSQRDAREYAARNNGLVFRDINNPNEHHVVDVSRGNLSPADRQAILNIAYDIDRQYEFHTRFDGERRPN